MEFLVLLITTIGLIPICLSFAGIVLAIWGTVYWIQTLVRLMKVERGDDRLAWLLLVLVLHFMGALIYNAVRGTAPAPRRAPESNWLGAQPPATRPMADSFQATLIIVGSVVLVMVICFTVAALQAVNNQPLPTLAVQQIQVPTATAWTLLTPTPDAGNEDLATMIAEQNIFLTGIVQTADSNNATRTVEALTPKPTATRYVIQICVCTDTPAPTP